MQIRFVPAVVIAVIFVIAIAPSAFANNNLWIDDQVNTSVLDFGAGSANKTTLETANGDTWINLPSVTAKWDKQTGGGIGSTLTLTIKAQSTTLSGSGGALNTKPIGDIEFSINQVSWQPLTGASTPQTVASNLTNPSSANQTITQTVYFRIKATFNDTMNTETGATWSLPTGVGGTNLLWSIG